MGLTKRCSSSPKYDVCGAVLEKRKLKTSFNSIFPVDYCSRCGDYIYSGGAENEFGIRSQDKKEIIKYVEKYEERMHLREMGKVEGFRNRLERGQVLLPKF